MKEAKLIVFGGMWEGILCVYSMEVDATIGIHKNHNTTITALAIDQTEKKIVTGTKSGECGLWNVSKNHTLTLKMVLNHHLS
jgi:WD40 repeat protein